jgi:predicted dehydrogenase
VSNHIGVAIVGCGGITSAHLNGIRIIQENNLDDVRIVALASRSEENIRRYNDREDAAPPLPPIVPWRDDPLNIRDIYVSDLEPHKPARVYTDWQDAVKDPEVDAVIILASVDVHHAIAFSALTEGKHVYLEKPFAITVRAARQICEMADERGLVCGVAESLRYKPDTRAMRWAIDEGRIGHLQMVAQASIGSVWSPDKIVGKTAWRHRKHGTGSGILMDIGSHLFDRVRYLLGEPETISGLVRTLEPLRTTRSDDGTVEDSVAADVEDTAFAHMTFANGAIGSFSMSWGGHGEPTSLQGGMAIYGDQGLIRGDRIISDDGQDESLIDTYEQNANRKQSEKWFPKGIEDAFALELHDFFRAIRDSGKPETDGWEGLRDIAVCYGIVESSHSGELVTFSDIENCRIENYQRSINDFYGLRS